MVSWSVYAGARDAGSSPLSVPAGGLPLDRELDVLRGHLLAMGGLVEQQLTTALSAWARRDIKLAQLARRGDESVDQAETEIDAECAAILRQRHLGDAGLQLILGVVKVLGELERIGDEAARVGKMAERSLHEELPATEVEALEHMGRLARSMLTRVLDAMARGDVGSGARVILQDDELNAAHRQFKLAVIALMQERPDAIPWLLNLLWAGRSIERIGDRCKNIAEYLVYMVQGRDVRHTGFGR